MHGDEIELKLALAPEGLERLRRHPLVRRHVQGRASTRTLVSTYYDTTDFTLARCGVTVRIRASGRHYVQTVKTAGSRVAGLFARREWEAPVPSRSIDPVLLRATGVPVLAEGDAVERLVPVFHTEIRRTTTLLAGDDWRVELALDRGEVGAGERREAISEAELELKQGAPAHLFALARDLVRAVPARLTSLSKSDRGYALAAGGAPAPVKSRPVAVSADMPVAEAFQAIARNCMEHLLANERVLLAAGDGEAIHQMRVALRRLRSAVKVFRRLVDGPQLAEIGGQVRWLLDHLGPARDGDVFLAEIVDPVVARYPGNPALASLRAQWLDQRDDRLDAARAAVAAPRFTDLLLAVGAWIEAGDWLAGPPGTLARPLGPFAAEVLAKRDRRTRKAGGKAIEALRPEELHRVRILGKQLRYAGEFFAPLYPRKATRTFLAILSELQDTLGALNDITVATTTLTAGHHDGDRAWAAGVVSGWHEARRPALMETAAAAWKRFRKAERFWQDR